MGKTKRPRDDESHVGTENVHPSRRKRVKYSEEDAQLAQIYNDLADEVQAVRIKAARDLLKNLSRTSDDRSRLDAAETRLIRGLCSGRKAARLGFSVALTELFRLKFSASSAGDEHSIALTPVLDSICTLTEPVGNVKGQERRDHLLGRRFAFQAILQSDVALDEGLPTVEWSTLLRKIFELANRKSWLRRECGAILYEYLISVSGSKLNTSYVQAIVDVASDLKQWKTPEGVGLWISIQERFPTVEFFKGVWHHKNPLSSKARSILSKVLQENAVDDDEAPAKQTGSRQSSPSFVWTVILSHLFTLEEDKPFAKFWENCVVSPMFSQSTSTERKSLGLQIISLAISSAPPSKIPLILHTNVLKCIIDQRGNPERYLYDAAKKPLNHIIARAEQEPAISGVLVRELITNGAVNFDQLTKTNTVDSAIKAANYSSLTTLAQRIKTMIEDTETQDTSQDERKRRMLADLLLTMVRFNRDAGSMLITSQSEHRSETSWLEMTFNILASRAYNSSISSASKAVFRSRMMSCINCLMDFRFEFAVKPPVYVIKRAISEATALKGANKNTMETVRAAQSCLEDSFERNGTIPRAFSLLLAMSILQVYNGEPDAVPVLQDLLTCYHAKDDTADSSTMVLELLLSFISKPSALFRKLAEQVFSAFAGELSQESLTSLTDILAQKESLSGQKELFDEQEGAEGEDGEDGEDMDVEDVEDASDTEMVIREDPFTSESNGDDDSGDDDESTSGDDEDANDDDDEEAAFDKKLADALGTAVVDEGSDDDGSDMDDEQMMALEPHLATIFKERRNGPSKKQEKKDAKENIVNFKNRVLDLLLIYVKCQYASPLALDLILPLATTVRTTSSKPTAGKAFAVLKQYFDACNKKKRQPPPILEEEAFEVLAAIYEEMKLGGSKLHANACSRSSLFLSKILVLWDLKYYPKIAEMYANLQSEWYLNPKSKVHGSVFTEWTSWSIATRKHG